jgi:hypothetical protein
MIDNLVITASDTHLAVGKEQDTTDSDQIKEFLVWVFTDRLPTGLLGDIYDYFQAGGFKRVVKAHPEVHETILKGMEEGIIFPIDGNHDVNLLRNLRKYLAKREGKWTRRGFYVSDKELRIPNMGVKATHGHEFEARYNLIIGKPWERYLNWVLGRLEQYVHKDVDALFSKLTRGVRKGELDKFYKTAAEMIMEDNIGYPIRIIGHTHEPDYKVIEKREGEEKPIIYTPEDIDLSQPAEFDLEEGRKYLLNDGACVNGRRDYLVLRKLDRKKYILAYLDMEKDGIGMEVLKNKGLLD